MCCVHFEFCCSLDCEVTYSVNEHRGRQRDEEEDNKPSNRSCVQGIDVPACVHRRRGPYLNCKFQYQIEDEIGKCRNVHTATTTPALRRNRQLELVSLPLCAVHARLIS